MLISRTEPYLSGLGTLNNGYLSPDKAHALVLQQGNDDIELCSALSLRLRVFGMPDGFWPRGGYYVAYFQKEYNCNTYIQLLWGMPLDNLGFIKNLDER